MSELLGDGGQRSADRSDAAPDRTGRFAAWWLAMLPLSLQWLWAAHGLHVDPGVVPVAVTAVIVLDHRRPRWALAVAVVASGWMAVAGGLVITLRFLPMLWVSGVLWGLASGALPGNLDHRWAPKRQLVFPSLIPLAAANLLLALWYGRYVVALPLIAIAAAVFAAGIAFPALGARLARATDPLEALLRDRATPLRERFCGRCRAASVLRGAWLDGELPRLAPDAPTRTISSPSEPAEPEGLRSYRFPALVWLGTTLAVNFVRLVAPATPPGADRGWFDGTTMRAFASGSTRFMGWLKWDSFEYLAIARTGYGYTPGLYVRPDGHQEPAAWFPGYGLLIRAISRPVGALIGARPSDEELLFGTVAVVVTLLSGLAIALLFWKWMTLHGLHGRSRSTALLCLLWFPFSFFIYGAGYSDPLFVALVLGAFVLLETDRPLTAGVVGAAATLVRVNGIALVIGMVVIALTVGPRHLRRRERASVGDAIEPGDGPATEHRVTTRVLIAAALSSCGIASFIAWCWVRYDEPLLYWNAHSAIFGKIDPFNSGDLLKFDLPSSIIDRFGTQPGAMLTLVAAAACTALCIGSLPAVARRFGAGYAALVAVQVAIVWFGSFDLIGGRRYLFCAFPVAALWGEWLVGHRVGRIAAAAIGVSGLMLLTFCFTQTIDLGW